MTAWLTLNCLDLVLVRLLSTFRHLQQVETVHRKAGHRCPSFKQGTDRKQSKFDWFVEVQAVAHL